MTHWPAPDRDLRELVAHQECEAEIRAPGWTSRPRPYSLSHTWSPTVMVGFLGVVVLVTIGFFILLLSAL